MGDRFTAEQEAALRAALEESTPGPWIVEAQYYDGMRYAIEIGAPAPDPVEPTDQVMVARCMDACGLHRKLYRREDADFIALAHNAMPALLAELAALRAENARLYKLACAAYPTMAEAERQCGEPMWCTAFLAEVNWRNGMGPEPKS